VCDVRPQILDAAREKYGVQTTSSITEALADPEIEGVAIAAPAVQHYQLVRQALEAGKDVLVEKPLALHLTEGRHLAEIADSHARVLMVGHILQYHPAILKLKELISTGELGRIKYIYSSRLNLGSCASKKTYCGVLLRTTSLRCCICWKRCRHESPAMAALHRLARRGHNPEHLPICQWRQCPHFRELAASFQGTKTDDCWRQEDGGL